MSTAVGTPQDRPRIAIGRVTQLHVIRSEWTKLWSLRSTRWSLLVAVVGMAGLGIVIRAAVFGGTVDAGPAQGGGWQVKARLMVEPDPR